jgi:hypothetical protein
MRRAALLVLVVLAAACGQKIGDSCNVSSDCAQDGTRVCDTFSPGGHCTIQGCDFGTCPSEAVCVRFFPALENAPPCRVQQDCTSYEICTVAGQCAPRSIEQRFCMLMCDDTGDCRTGYECRDRDLMQRHGGEPVPDPRLDSAEAPTDRFCGPRRNCAIQSDCGPDEVCDFQTRFCLPV